MVLSAIQLLSQNKIDSVVEFDKLIHDFGDVQICEKELNCSFKFKNISDKPIVIFSIRASCGCTNVTWSKKPIAPGQTSEISVIYSNEDGPYPFSKSLTVYISAIKSPVILSIRGIVHDKQKSLEELYPLNYGPFSMKTNVLKCGNLVQNRSKSEEVIVANTSSKPINVTFENTSLGLNLKLSPNPIPPRSTAKLVYIVNAQPNLWGKNYYYTVPVINGKRFKMSGSELVTESKFDPYEGNLRENTEKIAVYAFTSENFTNILPEQKASAPRPMFKTSTYSFGKIKRGESVKAKYSLSNTGKSDLKIHKADLDAYGAVIRPIPTVKPGSSTELEIELNSSQLPLGEALVIVTLTTNSPVRPIVNLFITGWIE